MLISSELLIMGLDEDVQISTHTTSKKQKFYQMMSGYVDVRDAARGGESAGVVKPPRPYK
jgi:hypothetical protein